MHKTTLDKLLSPVEVVVQGAIRLSAVFACIGHEPGTERERDRDRRTATEIEISPD